MRNSPDTLAAIRSVFDQAADHICSPGPNCCRGCTLARQIPGLLDDISELRAQLASAEQRGVQIGREAAAQAILTRAEEMDVQYGPHAARCRHMHHAAQIAASPITPEQAAEALRAVLDSPQTIVCRTKDIEPASTTDAAS